MPIMMHLLVLPLKRGFLHNHEENRYTEIASVAVEIISKI